MHPDFITQFELVVIGLMLVTMLVILPAVFCIGERIAIKRRRKQIEEYAAQLEKELKNE